MRSLLSAKGRSLITLDELLRCYRAKAFVLLHIKVDEPDESFFRMLRGSAINFICGIQSLKAAETCRRIFPPEQILAFMPALDMCVDFHRAGAGIIRLWENWLIALRRISARRLSGRRGLYNGKQSRHGYGWHARVARLLYKIGADGVLLNDIRMQSSI